MKPERFLAVGLESLLMPLILQALQIVPARPGLYPKKWILCTHFLLNESGQIIATSHDLTPNGGLVREIPLFQGNLGW